MKYLQKSLLPLAVVSLLPFTSAVQAHGYVSKPESRSYLCKLGENTRCGNVQWEPQSVEGPDRYPETGPADGTIAAAGLAGFAALNEQTASRWTKRTLATGWQQFRWSFTANHSSRDFRYFITKNGWNPNMPLTRAQFEPQPFCQYSGNNQQPPKELTHDCMVPADHSGYHVVLAVWDVADTAASFYNVIDLQLNGTDQPVTPVQYNDIGDLLAERTLNAGDTAQLRFFDAQGEVASLLTELTVNNEQAGQPSNWTLALAEKVNAKAGELRIGVKNANGSIAAVAGRNDIFAKAGSGIVRAELTIKEAPVAAPVVQVSGIQSQYQLTKGTLDIWFTVVADQNSQLSVSLNNGAVTAVSQQYQLTAGSQQLLLSYPAPVAGHYNLSLFYTNAQGGQGQQNFHTQLLAETTVTPPPVSTGYDYVFGVSLSSYKAGTKVLQKKNGKVYQCKPWPYSGYCVQWSASATQFEPGVGTHWREAWIAL